MPKNFRREQFQTLRNDLQDAVALLNRLTEQNVKLVSEIEILRRKSQWQQRFLAIGTLLLTGVVAYLFAQAGK